MKIRFVFVGEGPTDVRLVPLLQILCVLCGAEEASGVAPDLRRLPDKPGRAVVDQVTAALALEPNANIVFVHRDADRRSPALRNAEIERAAETVDVPVIAVVPIQQTEAWLLLDEKAVRDVAGNPRGDLPLGLPRPSRVESTANSKEVLRQALIAASELKGRRLEKFKNNFGIHRALLFDRIDPNGPITKLSAWNALSSRIKTRLQESGEQT